MYYYGLLSLRWHYIALTLKVICIIFFFLWQLFVRGLVNEEQQQEVPYPGFLHCVFCGAQGLFMDCLIKNTSAYIVVCMELVVDKNPQSSTRRSRRTRFERLRLYYHLHKVTTVVAIPLPDIASKTDEISKTQKAHNTNTWTIMVIYICNNTRNNDTSQHSSTNNRIVIQYNNPRPQMGVRPASLWKFTRRFMRAAVPHQPNNVC